MRTLQLVLHTAASNLTEYICEINFQSQVSLVCFLMLEPKL